jgi:putative transposase
VFKAFVYRLYPSKSQRGRLEAVRETCRHFYNDCLRERKEAYEERGETISRIVQLRKVKVEKDTSPYAFEIHSHILQNVVADLDKAFQAFFHRVKAGENPGYPRFKGRFRFAGFGYKEYRNGFKVDGRRLKLSGIGRIAVRWHREIEGTIKMARVFCRAGKWFVAFSCEVEKPEPLPKTGESIGIDLGLLQLATLSNGEEAENPRWYRRILRKLRIIQRSGCGALFEHLSLSDRWISCDCGVSLDRDHNAAINILQRGLGRSLWASSSTLVGLAQEAARL